jgi:photosystem II stability/assembly factor-like uncharacterized protein
MARIVSFALLALVAVGCSSDPATPYMGTWSFASGSDNVSCPNGTNSTALQGNVTIKHATDGGLLVLDPEGCNFTYEIGADRASASAKSCSFAVPELGQGVTAAVTYDSISLATHDGKTMDDTFSGTVTYTSSAGALDCIFSGTASLNKISNE